MLATAAVLVVALATSAHLWHRGRKLEAALGAVRDTLGMLRQPGEHVLLIPVRIAGHPGTLTIYADTLSGRWLVTCHDLAPNVRGETYQLWFVTATGVHAAESMRMDGDAPMVMTLEVPTGIGPVTGVAMSIEPHADAVAPTGPMLFRVDL